MKKRYIVLANKRRRAIRASRYSDSVPYENRKYWYFTTHGIGPGMLPSDVHILDTQEGQNRKGTWGDYILLDAVLNTDELREYDLVELAPKEIEDKMVSRAASRSKGSRFNNYIFPDAVESATKVRSRRAIRASKDYATLRGTDFTKARDILTKDGYHEHEYGDKDDNTGYAVYRKGNKEVELQYRWVAGKRKGDAHAGKVTNVYVDDNIYGAAASTRLPQHRVMASNYNPNGFAVTGYYDSNYRGAAADRYFDPNELDEAASYAHDLLSNGLYVNIIYWGTGDKVDITPDEYFDNFDGDFWCTRDLVEFKDIVQDELADAVWNLQHGDVNSAKTITCSYDADDIVMYFNGKKVFTGSVYDLTDTIEELCEDPVILEKFQEWCNEYGDPFDFDGTPRDTAATFVALIEDEMDYYDGDPDHTFYASGQKGLDFEIFYADQEVGIPD